ncbi:hypothetical protein ACFOLC_04430 [Lysobacter cavernae]|uniref:EF-hand domain-containing protein n=1 Tax=Lysobacter cavernae TaxID=1685901 RepID=A0ABV7RLK6_9GAMM
MRVLVGFSLLLIAGMAQAQVANCAAVSAPKALPIRPTVIAPIASELVVPRPQLGAPTGVLSQAFDEALSVDQVLFRMRLEGCQVAKAMPAATPGAMPSASDPAAYKPKTQFDNTPWRFDMNQNGKRMTAEEFDAWMKAKGVRVAKGKGAVAAPAAAPAEPAKDEKKKK